MKAINKIIILGMVTTLFSSCDLTLLPENAVTPENYFQNKSDLELWTNQFYTLLDEPDASAGTNADDMIDKGMPADSGKRDKIEKAVSLYKSGEYCAAREIILTLGDQR